MTKLFTNSEIDFIYNGLKQIRENKSLKIPLLMEWCIIRNLDTFSKYQKEIIEFSNELIKKYGQKDEDGQYIIKKDDLSNINNYKNDLSKYLKESREIPVEAFSHETLEGFEGIGIDNLSYLIFMIN